jgi:ribonuclease D
VPPYVILTNAEMVAVIAARPESLTALGNVPGIGPSKVQRHGTALLRILARSAGGARSGEAVEAEAPAAQKSRATPRPSSGR